jgi:putative transposase
MPNYIRAKFEGGYYFFTVVTHRRAKLLNTQLARDCLREAIDFTQSRRPFEPVAWCLLPDHLHCVWRLPDGDADYSIRWASIKGRFSQAFLKAGGRQIMPPPSRQRKGEAGLWQRRFWEHRIRDEDDLQRHVDYVHYNPIKHGLVECVEDWPWSSYHRYVRAGIYGGPDPLAGAAKLEAEGFGE